MTTDKEVLKKLYKIASNQQKILRKLAQEAPIAPMTIKLNVGVIQNLVDRFAGAGTAQVQSASLQTATDSSNNVVKKLMMSVLVLNREAYNKVSGGIETALKSPNALVDDKGERHTAQDVSINAFDKHQD
jgi:hypothetical protein